MLLILIIAALKRLGQSACHSPVRDFKSIYLLCRLSSKTCKTKVYLASQLLLVVVFAKLKALFRKVNSFINLTGLKKAEMRDMRQRCIINVLQPCVFSLVDI